LTTSKTQFDEALCSDRTKVSEYPKEELMNQSNIDILNEIRKTAGTPEFIKKSKEIHKAIKLRNSNMH
jgi:hypothetical protein